VQEWLKANGGAYALMFFGLAIVSPKLLGAIIFSMGFLLWLNDRKWLPVRAVRRFDLDLAVTDLVFSPAPESGPGRIQVLAAVINRGGAATILHSWTLEIRLPDRIEQGIHFADAEPIDTTRPSLSDEASIVPLPPGTTRGFLSFGLKRFNADDVLDAKSDGALTLAATDQSGKTWVFEQPIADLTAIGESSSGPGA
jgi:hypothetical protein